MSHLCVLPLLLTPHAFIHKRWLQSRPNSPQKREKRETSPRFFPPFIALHLRSAERYTHHFYRLTLLCVSAYKQLISRWCSRVRSLSAWRRRRESKKLIWAINTSIQISFSSTRRSTGSRRDKETRAELRSAQRHRGFKQISNTAASLHGCQLPPTGVHFLKSHHRDLSWSVLFISAAVEGKSWRAWRHQGRSAPHWLNTRWRSVTSSCFLLRPAFLWLSLFWRVFTAATTLCWDEIKQKYLLCLTPPEGSEIRAKRPANANLKSSCTWKWAQAETVHTGSDTGPVRGRRHGRTLSKLKREQEESLSLSLSFSLSAV